MNTPLRQGPLVGLKVIEMAGVEPGVDVHAALQGWGMPPGEIDALVASGSLA